MTGLLIYLACLLTAVVAIYAFGTWYLGPEEPLQ